MRAFLVPTVCGHVACSGDLFGNLQKPEIYLWLQMNTVCRRDSPKWIALGLWSMSVIHKTLRNPWTLNLTTETPKREDGEYLDWSRVESNSEFSFFESLELVR